VKQQGEPALSGQACVRTAHGNNGQANLAAPRRTVAQGPVGVASTHSGAGKLAVTKAPAARHAEAACPNGKEKRPLACGRGKTPKHPCGWRVGQPQGKPGAPPCKRNAGTALALVMAPSAHLSTGGRHESAPHRALWSESMAARRTRTSQGKRWLLWSSSAPHAPHTDQMEMSRSSVQPGVAIVLSRSRWNRSRWNRSKWNSSKRSKTHVDKFQETRCIGKASRQRSHSCKRHTDAAPRAEPPSIPWPLPSARRSR